MTDRPLRVGIVGAGFIAEHHAAAVRDLGAELAAVCDTDLAQAVRAGARWRCNAYARTAQMFAREALDVVHVLVPPHLHAGIAIEALDAGCHVFVEKPAAATARECDAIAAAARRAGRAVGVNHNFPYHPAFVRLVKAAREWRFGALEHVSVCWHVPLRQLRARQYDHWMFTRPERLLLEQAVHPLSMIQRLLGGPLRARVAATDPVELPGGGTLISRWEIGLVCARGTANCHLAFGTDLLATSVAIVGQDATAVADLRRNTCLVREKTRFVDPADDLFSGLRDSGQQLAQSAANFCEYALRFLKLSRRPDPFSQSIAASVRDFYDSLVRGSAPPVSIDEARTIVCLCEEIATSAVAPLEASVSW